MPPVSTAPRTLARQSRVVSASGLLFALLAAPLTACRPPDDTRALPSPRFAPATNPPGHVATLVARLTATASGPTAEPTTTPRPTLDPAVPLPVAMTLGEAEAEVLSWLDPTREPRIEWSGYVGRDDLAWFAGPRPCSFDSLWRVGLDDAYDPDPDALDSTGKEPLPEAGIVVIASTLGLSMGIERSHGGSGGVGSDACNSAADERERIVGLLDGRTGRWLVATRAWMGEDVTAQWQASRPLIRSVPMPVASPTLSVTAEPSPTAHVWPTPVGQPVDRDTVPPELRDTLRAYPLLPGSRWTWRIVERLQGVAWRTSLLTETVEAAWLLAPDRLAVRSLRGRTVLHAGILGDDTAETLEQEVWRLVLAEGMVFVSEQPLDVNVSLSEPWYDPAELRPGILMESLHPHGGATTDGPAFWHDDDITVITAAGTFHGCRGLLVLGGAAWGSTRAFCPGVGYVTTDSGACSMCSGMLATMDLVDYRVVPPR